MGREYNYYLIYIIYSHRVYGGKYEQLGNEQRRL